MQRVDIPELLDSDACSPEDVQTSLRDMLFVNRWFGGLATTQALIERVAQTTGLRRFSLLEVGAGTGESAAMVQERLARRDISLNITLLDRAWSHLPKATKSGGAIVADAIALPFSDSAFDLVSCNLFAHHLNPEALARFACEALRVSRVAVLINDLVRSRLHLGLVYAGFPLLSAVSQADGVASVRRAYVPSEIREILLSGVGRSRRIEISRRFLFRMGVIVWKDLSRGKNEANLRLA